ncbi:hypothetical protein WBG78_18760 [Chryseolinea sp. T2]|uniref:hypothetical protein n=1 Tax=Chryseolinea sp. T2 TaxID=3129255 RepID=UPI0030786141
MFIALSCVDHKAPPENPVDATCPEPVSYADQVKPILDTHCAIVGDGGCHNGGNGASRDWRNFNIVQSHAQEIKTRIHLTPGSSGFMPKIGSISDEQIRLISCWVDQGAKNN